MDRAQKTGVLIATLSALVALVAIVTLKATVDSGVAGAVVDYFL